MATRFYLSTSTTGAVNVTGVSPAAGSTSASRVLDTTQPGAAAYTVSAASSNTTDSICTTPALNGWAWQALSATVSLNITTGNSLVAVSVAVARINSSGAVQAQGAFSAEQTASAGVKSLTATAPSWGTPTSTDRLALITRVRNTAGGGSRSITFTVGATHYVDAPVQLGLALPTGTTGTLAVGTPTIRVSPLVASTGAGLSLVSGIATVVRQQSPTIVLTGLALGTDTGMVGEAPPAGVVIPSPGLQWPTETLDPLVQLGAWATLDPMHALTWFTTASSVGSVPVGGGGRTVYPTGLSIAVIPGAAAWPSDPQPASWVTLVPYWVRRLAQWRPLQRGTFTRAVPLLANGVTVVPPGFDLTLTPTSVAGFGAQAAGFTVRPLPWWVRFAVWRPVQRLQVAPSVVAPLGTVTVTPTGLTLTSTVGSLPNGSRTTGVAGMALSLVEGAVAVTLTGNRTVVPSGSSVGTAVGSGSTRSSATAGVTGQALTLGLGSPAGATQRTVTSAGFGLAIGLGNVTVTKTSGSPVLGQGFAVGVGTVVVLKRTTIAVSGTSVGSASGVALARFPVQAPSPVGIAITVGASALLAYATVPLEQGAASLYGPFDADQVFGAGS